MSEDKVDTNENNKNSKKKFNNNHNISRYNPGEDPFKNKEKKENKHMFNPVTGLLELKGGNKFKKKVNKKKSDKRLGKYKHKGHTHKTKKALDKCKK